MLMVLMGASLIGLSLGILGSGGALLTVPMLIYGLGYSEKSSHCQCVGYCWLHQCNNSFDRYQAKKINWTLVTYFGTPSMVSAYVGAWGSSYVSGRAQVMVLAIVMLAAAWRMFGSSKVLSPHKLNRLLTIMQGIMVGLLTGFVGVGGGFLIVPALVLLGGIVMSHAIFTSLVVISINSASGFIKYHSLLHENNQLLDWPAITIISMIGIVGSFIGQYYSMKLPQQKIKNAFAVSLTIMAIFILCQRLLFDI